MTLRILHAAPFDLRRDALRANISPNRRLSHGLCELGHGVYDFSYRDVAREQSILPSKRGGIRGMNHRLLKTANHYEPDLILLGHAELVQPSTLSAIRESLPETRIALYWVDPMWDASRLRFIHELLPQLDAFLATTGGEWLAPLHQPGTACAFMPNPVHPAFDRFANFNKPGGQFDIDLLYCGGGKRAGERETLIGKLQSRLPAVKFEIRGMMGQPPAYGPAYDRLLLQSKMGVNLSRRNDVTLYSSDRLWQLTGSGLLTFSPRVPEMASLFGEDEVVYFDGVDEAAERIEAFQRDDARRRAVAEAGWRKAHTAFAARRLAKYIIEVALNRPFSEAYEWATHVRR